MLFITDKNQKYIFIVVIRTECIRWQTQWHFHVFKNRVNIYLIYWSTEYFFNIFHFF